MPTVVLVIYRTEGQNGDYMLHPLRSKSILVYQQNHMKLIVSSELHL